MTTSTPQLIDTLISASWIIPVEPAQRLLRDHAIAIQHGTIIDILPREQALQRYDATHGINLPKHVLTPGLINSHGHAAMTLFRGMADDYPLKAWLEEHIWPAEGQWVSEEFVRDGARLAIAEMLRSGTTTFSDMYFFPNIVAKVASDAGIRAQISFPVFDFPTVWARNPEEYIHKGLAVRDDFKHSDLIDVVFGPHAPYTVGDDALARIAVLAAELDTNIHIHVHETAAEVEEAIAGHGQRPLARLRQLGLLTPRTQLVHMTAVNDDDLQCVAEAGSHIVHCAQSNLKLASGICPVQRFLDAGVNVALGTDGAASNNSLDMFAEMRSAALLAKLAAGDASALSDHRALYAATMGGARAMGLDQKLGSLTMGKQADIIAIDLGELEQQPLYEPISQLVYTPCGHHVSHSWINGNPVLADRQPVNLNLAEIIAKAEQWRHTIQATSE